MYAMAAAADAAAAAAAATAAATALAVVLLRAYRHAPRWTLEYRPRLTQAKEQNNRQLS